VHALRTEAARGALPAPHRLTVAGLLKQWLADCRVRGLRPKSLAGYEQCARLYLAPALGTVKVRALRPEHVRTALAALIGRGIAPSTVRKARGVLHAALQLAVRTELVGRNVVEAVQPPRLARAELHPPTPGEAVRFLDVAGARGDPLLALFVLAVYTGCRPGELLALKWPDVDWDAGRLRIRRNLTQVRGKSPTLAEPKTARGRRVLSLPPEAMAALRTHLAGQAHDRSVLGPDYEDADLVFCTRTGTPLLPSNVVRTFKRLLGVAGLRSTIRLYDLRHANATAMLAAGVHPKVASERLGHAGVTLFMDTYSHLLPELEAGAAAALQDVLGRARAAAGSG
jgi:integrase